jgi:1-acyl-sn-glycerol-3-phosphate acyltransferase
MAEQDGGMKPAAYKPSFLHTVLVAIDIVLATFVFSSTVIVTVVLSRRVAEWAARTWARLWLLAAGAKCTVSGLDRLSPEKRYVFVSNHQSGLDIPLLYVLLPYHLSFIAKKELFYVPFLGWGMAAIGHIYIDRANARRAHQSIGRAVEKLRKEHRSLVVFPEGTRSADGHLGAFKSGSFALAIEAGVELVPVVIDGSCRVLPKGTLMTHPGPVHVAVGEPISVEGLVRSDKAELAQRVRGIVTDMLEQQQTANVSETPRPAREAG